MSDASQPPLGPDELWALLNAQTAQVAWDELEPHFQRGALIRVADDLDLVAVAVAVVNDRRDQVEPWLQQGRLQPADASTIADWRVHGVRLWAVVTPPWVLVQERSP